MADDTFSRLMGKTNPTPSPTPPVSPVKIKQPQKTKKVVSRGGESKKEQKQEQPQETISEDIQTISNIASTEASMLDSKLDSSIASLIADTARRFKEQKIQGAIYSEVSFARLTKEDKSAIRSLLTYYNNKGIKITENELVRIITSFMLADQLARKNDSLLAKLLASIYKS